MSKTTSSEKIAFAGIVFCFLILGWMDAQDARLAEKYAASQTGQQLACIHCGEGR